MEFEVKRSGCGCGGCVAGVTSVALSLAIAAIGMFAVVGMPKGGSDEVAAALEACPAVAAAMGSPIRPDRLSMGCGEQSSGGGSGSATWTIGVSGSKLSGDVSYRATYLGNQPWTIESAVVDLDDGRSIVAVPCTGGSAPAPRAPAPDRDRGKGGKRR
jgi:hypothetical protein